jgi:hypothetical protein
MKAVRSFALGFLVFAGIRIFASAVGYTQFGESSPLIGILVTALLLSEGTGFFQNTRSCMPEDWKTDPGTRC